MNEVKIVPKGYEGIPKSAWSELGKRVMLIFPIAWNRLFKGKRFTEDGKELYKMAPRSGERRGGLPVKGSYTAKKLRLKGHQLALVFSGRGMREAQAANDASSGHTNGGEFWSRARMPNIFNLRNPRGRTDPPRESTAIVPAEEDLLEGLSQQKLHAELVRRSDNQGYIS